MDEIKRNKLPRIIIQLRSDAGLHRYVAAVAANSEITGVLGEHGPLLGQKFENLSKEAEKTAKLLETDPHWNTWVFISSLVKNIHLVSA